MEPLDYQSHERSSMLLPEIRYSWLAIASLTTALTLLPLNCLLSFFLAGRAGQAFWIIEYVSVTALPAVLAAAAFIHLRYDKSLSGGYLAAAGLFMSLICLIPCLGGAVVR